MTRMSFTWFFGKILCVYVTHSIAHNSSAVTHKILLKNYISNILVILTAINLQNSGDISRLEGEKDISRLRKKDRAQRGKKNEACGSRVVRQEAISKGARNRETSIDRTTSRAGCREISHRRVSPCFTSSDTTESKSARSRAKNEDIRASTLALTRKQKISLRK